MEKEELYRGMEKGKLYYGPAGVGKTTQLREDYEALEDRGKGWLTADDLTRMALTDGLLRIMDLARNHFVHVFLDDIGHEPASVSHFGTVFSPVAEFIKARYNKCKDEPRWHKTTHFTTNLTPAELREHYGAYIFDRMIEMCEWHEKDGQSFRK